MTLRRFALPDCFRAFPGFNRLTVRGLWHLPIRHSLWSARTSFGPKFLVLALYGSGLVHGDKSVMVHRRGLQSRQSGIGTSRRYLQTAVLHIGCLAIARIRSEFKMEPEGLFFGSTKANR